MDQGELDSELRLLLFSDAPEAKLIHLKRIAKACVHRTFNQVFTSALLDGEPSRLQQFIGCCLDDKVLFLVMIEFMHMLCLRNASDGQGIDEL
eukprot:gene7589-21_t